MKKRRITIKEKIKELFGVDLRSLALFRISLALIIIADLIRRSEDLIVHYTDSGLLARSLVPAYQNSSTLFSPYFWDGSVLFVSFLFVLQGLFALALLVGYHSRIAAFLSWIMMISLHDRNSMILYGGDNLVHVMLFWALFIPLGASYSLDRALSKDSKPPPQQICTIGTFAFILQICMIYWSSVAFKWNPDWLQGKAVEISLNIEQFATDAGLWLKEQKALLPPLTYLTLFFEMLGPFFAFIPFYTGPIRTATVAGFIILHFSFATFLALGLFPFICATAWFFFLPSWFWDHFLPRFSFLIPPFIAHRYRSLQTWISSSKIIDRIPFKRSDVEWRSFSFENTVVTILCVYNVFTTLYMIHLEWGDKSPFLKKYALSVSEILHLNQKWNMFSRPLREDGWYVIVGILENGKQVDLFRQGQPVSWEKPEHIYSMYSNDRWRKYMMNIWMKDNYKHRGYFSDYLCKEWNQTHSVLLYVRKIKFYFLLNKTKEDLTKSPVEKILIWEQDCHPQGKQDREAYISNRLTFNQYVH